MRIFEKLFRASVYPLAMLGMVSLLAVSYFYWDRSIAAFFYEYDLGKSSLMLQWVTKLGLGGPYLIGFLLLGFVFRYVYIQRTWEARAWFLWLSVTIPNLVCLVLKNSLGRSRPILWLEDGVYGFFGFHHSSYYWSCPSGHTTTIMGLAFGLCVVFPKQAWYWLLLGFIVATSRIMLYYHYLSDVLLATYLALIEVGLLTYYCQKRKYFTSVIRIRDI